MLSTALTGFFASLGLIVAIGAQNAFVLRQGIRREHVATVVAVCTLSDWILIPAGTLGIGAIVERLPAALVVLKWLGGAYLLWFAISSFRSAAHPKALAEEAPRSTASVAATALALTWLNPHVYLDTVVLLGNLANQHGSERWIFTLGACTASFLWFTGLGYGARALAGPLGRPRVWQVIDVVIGVVMAVLACVLVTH